MLLFFLIAPRSLCIIFFISLSCAINAYSASLSIHPLRTDSSATVSPPDSSFMLWRDLKSAGRDMSAVYSRSSWTDIGYIAGGATGLVALCVLTHTDNTVRDLAQRNQSKFGADFFPVVNEIGHTNTGAGLGAALYLGGWALGSEDIRITGRLMFESLLLAGTTTTILKGVIGRARPYTNLGDATFRPFSFKDDFYALPSGHSTVAFTMASVLSERVGNTYASIGFYTIAFSAAAARIYLDKHWLSDVLIGGTIGTLSGMAVVRAEESLHNQRSSTQWYILPTLNGVQISLMW